MKKCIIFDMDGVLIDSEPIYTYETLKFFKDHDIFIDYNDVKKLAGSSREVSLQKMVDWWREPITIEAMEKYYDTHHQKETWTFPEILNPYVKFILPRLKYLNYKLAIASSSPMSDIIEMASECGIENYFDVFVTGRDFSESKPNPEIYLSTMKQLEVSPQETIIIEDSTYGIEAGKRAKGTVVAIRDERFYDNQSESDFLVYDLFEAYQKIISLY